MLNTLPSRPRRIEAVLDARYVDLSAQYRRYREIADPALEGYRRLAASRAARIAWWITVRVAVAAACVATVMALAQLTVQVLIAIYANIPPYSAT
ncbi:MAG: hypothetical protein HY332_23055 [Chloroflexi bacterium]|nr:hypothetical protein [Chloroflexota bacterium]